MVGRYISLNCARFVATWTSRSRACRRTLSTTRRSVLFPCATAALTLLCAGCIGTNMIDNRQIAVEAIPAIAIDEICVGVNSQHKPALVESDIQDALRRLGFASRIKQATFAGECRYWLNYEIDMVGFLPQYVGGMRVRVYDQDRQIGAIAYWAGPYEPSPEHYGPPIRKLEPLLEELLHQVER